MALHALPVRVESACGNLNLGLQPVTGGRGATVHELPFGSGSCKAALGLPGYDELELKGTPLRDGLLGLGWCSSVWMYTSLVWPGQLTLKVWQ